MRGEVWGSPRVRLTTPDSLLASIDRSLVSAKLGWLEFKLKEVGRSGEWEGQKRSTP